MKVLAMPRNIGPVKSSDPHVQYVREKAQQAFNTQAPGLSSSPSIPGLWYLKSSDHSGVFFTLLKGRVNFVYSHDPLVLNGSVHAAESLAFRWEPDLESSGILRPIFYDILLPSKHVVITDAEYSDDGKKWWKAQYNEAARNLTKYGLLLAEGANVREIGVEEFKSTQAGYWGDSEEFSRYRFGIFLRSSGVSFPTKESK